MSACVLTGYGQMRYRWAFHLLDPHSWDKGSCVLTGSRAIKVCACVCAYWMRPKGIRVSVYLLDTEIRVCISLTGPTLMG